MRALIALCLFSLVSAAGCAQLKARSSGTPNQVGKASKPNASGFLSMPFLTGLSEDEARQTMADSQMTGEIKIERVECFDKAIPAGHVCNQYPSGGTQTSTESGTTLYLVGAP